MAGCPGLGSDSPFVSGMLGYIDCQAVTIGAGGYRALATPGSTVSIVLTGALTLFVALFGYRMLFGQTPGVRDATVAMVKIGFVLVLATSWGAYRTLAYDVVLRGPAELAGQVGGGAALPSARGGLGWRLQNVDDTFVALQTLDTGEPTAAVPAAAQVSQREQQPQQAQQQPLPRVDPARDQTMLDEARTLYLTGAIGSVAAVQIVGGLLLALGPLFALFLLFDATRGVFDGWVRALFGVVLGAASNAIILGVELALFEPWLAAILADRQAGVPTPAVPAELLVASLVFALTLLAGLIASGRIAYAVHIPAAAWRASRRVIGLAREQGPAVVSSDRAIPATVSEDRSRARAIADAATAVQRREEVATPISSVRLVESGGNPGTPARGPEPVTITPIGQSARRRTAGRVSAGRNRRDAR